jgi:hypothetical protein
MTCYAKHVFWHLVRSVGHVVHSGASGVQSIETLFFMLWWARCTAYRKHIETRYAELGLLCPVGFVGHVVFSDALSHKTSTTIFHARVGPVQNQ